MGQQPHILRSCGCPVVQPVLRPLARQGFPDGVAHADDAVVLHPHGPQRCFLERMGNYPEGVAGLLEEYYSRTHRRNYRADNLVVPAAAYLKMNVMSAAQPCRGLATDA